MNGIEALQHLQAEATAWRRQLHENPELDYRLDKTARFVAEKLASFGVDHIETGIAETGIVALIYGQSRKGPTIALRADMDALPILEQSDKLWSSKVPGKMHACGHDGHMAILLGAAKYLAASRRFKGSVALIFQPAEESGEGGQRMVQAGIMDRFSIAKVFGLHNVPGIKVGHFGICQGPIMAALDEFDLIVKGRGGHAAKPQEAIDPVVIAAQIVVGLQALVSRKTNPMEALVISVTKLKAAQAYNVIPDQVDLAGSVRTLVPDLQDFAQGQIFAAARGIARGFGADVEFEYRRSAPVTINHPGETDLAVKAARDLVGPACVDEKISPRMGSEDFAYMLEARPGAIIFLGNGSTASLHHPGYDFNDEALPYGIGYRANVVETVLAL
ncbi:M20 aminoacylase family protein [Bradyrhizobium sp. Arg816]|uniref:M20 aminoacylase family protein n=1 Tax=Bradyrhizobium sp. Arg816 TaxID=2998491 RepID=UPI00249EC79B|nr:M20 aminoacylase family protein [Bradyrhizobium sp. Arg816]MDI3566672.1 M20 family metallopeptidase [Bradyrhizobium sp. Arg816]